MEGGEGVEFGLPQLGKAEPLPAVIVGIGGAAEQASPFCSVDEFDGGVVAELEPVCDLADSGRLLGIGTADGEEKLVLGRSEPGGLGGFLGEVYEGTQGPAELGQGTIFRMGHGSAAGASLRHEGHWRPTLSLGDLANSYRTTICWRHEVVTEVSAGTPIDEGRNLT